MSIKFTSIHTVREGDTLESLVTQYRLSSRKAILEIELNAPNRQQLGGEGELPVGMLVHIPPNAINLAKERLYKLQEIRPVLLSHFDTMRGISESDLQPALAAPADPMESEDVIAVLNGLGEFVTDSIDSIAANTSSLVAIGIGMSSTHVATPADRAVEESANHPHCGLYWAVTPRVLAQWQTMWDHALWTAKWNDVAAGAAWQRASQYKTTIRSIVVQQIDLRIRETQSLQRSLNTEDQS